MEEQQKVQLSIEDVIMIRTWLTKTQEILSSHEGDLKDIFLQIDKFIARLEAITSSLQDVSRDTRDLKQIAMEQRQSTRNLWYGVLLAIATALIGKFVAVMK